MDVASQTAWRISPLSSACLPASTVETPIHSPMSCVHLIGSISAIKLAWLFLDLDLNLGLLCLLKAKAWICSQNMNGKDYSGAKFFYTEPISLNKAHSTKWKALDNKTLHLYNHSQNEFSKKKQWMNIILSLQVAKVLLGGRGSSVGRARDSWWGSPGFDSRRGRPLPTGWVGVSIMCPAETAVMVSQLCLMCGST